MWDYGLNKCWIEINADHNKHILILFLVAYEKLNPRPVPPHTQDDLFTKSHLGQIWCVLSGVILNCMQIFNLLWLLVPAPMWFGMKPGGKFFGLFSMKFGLIGCLFGMCCGIEGGTRPSMGLWCGCDGECGEWAFGNWLKCSLFVLFRFVLSFSIISANALADSFHGSKP